MKEKYINWKGGYLRFRNNFEINWSIYDWALPVDITFMEVAFFLRVLCISFIFPRKLKK